MGNVVVDTADNLEAACLARRPRHVAFIMDGNGRWANARGLLRTQGHRKGAEVVREVVRQSIELDIEHLTLFSFSSENWSRPADEVNELLGLLRMFIRRDLADLHKNNVRIRIIGRRDDLKSDILDLLVEAELVTTNNTGLQLTIAFNYGARDELVRAIQSLASEVLAGTITLDEICENRISDALDTSGLPDPDLIIRTSGEKRLSNFLMWQAAYAEFVFLDVNWPDFKKSDYLEALDEFASRDRRFGATHSSVDKT